MHFRPSVAAPAAFCALLAVSASAGLRSWEPSDYVQDGLVLNFDGIRNQGLGVPHGDGIATWANLGSAGGVATFTGTADGSAWTGSGYVFGGASYATVPNRVALTNTVTIQVVSAVPYATISSGSAYPMFIGGQTTAIKDACNVYLNKGSNIFTFKDTDGGNANLAKASWDGKYINAIRDGSSKYIFSGAARPASPTTTTDKGNIGSVLFSLGSAAGNAAGTSGWDARYLKGEVKAFRLFDRVLSDDQLAQNRALDEIRFFTGIPATNAVVATALAGAEGAEASGAYAVDEDGYTFRAAASAVVAGTTYACTGCTVAAWDDSTGGWGAAETRDGVFAVSVAASDKVKITWQWAAVSGSPDAAGYATDGLALWLDGVWNAGPGSHDASATAWKDLSGNGRDAFLAGNADGSSYWTPSGFYFNKNAVFNTAKAFQLGLTNTIEVLVDSSTSDYPSGNNGFVFLNGANSSTPGYVYFHKNSPNCLRYRSTDVTGIGWSAEPGVSYASSGRISYFTVLRKGESAAMISGTEIPTTSDSIFPTGNANICTNWSTGTKNALPADSVWRFGAGTADASSMSGTYGQFKGVIKSIRAYTRLLSNEELAANRAIDEARFSGAAAPATGAVVVQSAIAGLEGREASGTYFPDGWTFSAGTGTQTARGIEWQCAGYQIQSWDAGSGTWGAQTEVLRDAGNGVEYTPPSGTSFASVRLTWLWEPVSGVRTAADYAIADYATGGLQLHLDGLARGGSATVWSDLSGNGRNATLAGNGTAESHWTSDGYFFASNAVFTTANTSAGIFSLGHAYTMQALGDVNFADNYTPISHHATYVSPISNVSRGSIWLKSDGMGTIQHHTSDTTGAAWDMRGAVYVGTAGHATYLTALRNGARAALVEGTAYPTTENTKAHQACMDWSVGSKDDAAAAVRWGIGSTTLGGGGDPLYGTVKSIRLYDRMLSEGELAWNRAVDEARFSGALTVTNVIVEASDYNGDLAAGAYQVFGTATFAASRSASGASANQVRVRSVGPDGSLGNLRFVDGASYEWTAAEGTVSIEFRQLSPLVFVIR